MPFQKWHLQQCNWSLGTLLACDDPLPFEENLPLLDTGDRDTLWTDCIYSDPGRERLVLN